MEGKIYDEGMTPTLAFNGVAEESAHVESSSKTQLRLRPEERGRIAVISNPRSHRNKHRPLHVPNGVKVVAPATRPDLRRVLDDFVRDGIELLIIAGGDGTVRDVLTSGVDVWSGSPEGGGRPQIGVLPCGKTNALAIDLGVPDKWDIADMIGAWRESRETRRPPLVIDRMGEGRPVLGFLFGAGAFVDATELAQTTHRFGAVNNLAVGISILSGIGSTLVGGRHSRWRRGKRMALRFARNVRAHQDAALSSDGNRFLFVASTMERLPLGIRIFGEPRAGLKTLTVDAMPRRFIRNFIRVLRGIDTPEMERDGLHRIDAMEVEIDLDGGFVLDGERFPAGHYRLREGEPIAFVTP